MYAVYKNQLKKQIIPTDMAIAIFKKVLIKWLYKC